MIRKRPFSPEKICELLSPYLSRERAQRINDVIQNRTRSIVTVVEGITNYGNVSAVMRTAEALGFFEVHVVTSDQPYKQSRRTSQGAEKWLDVRRWRKSAECIGDLRERGYQIAVADSGPDAVPLSRVDFLRKTAIVLGNEVEGVSEDFRAASDVVCRIDMIGFVESYNISVAAALMLYHAHLARTSGRDDGGDLSATEKQALTAEYYLRAVQRAEEILLEDDRRAD